MHSISRNKKILNNQNKRGDNTGKIKNNITDKHKRITSEVDLYSKKIMNLSLNKLPAINGHKKNFKIFDFNKTYIASPGFSLNNISFSKIKKENKNKINISKNAKFVLL